MLAFAGKAITLAIIIAYITINLLGLLPLKFYLDNNFAQKLPFRRGASTQLQKNKLADGLLFAALRVLNIKLPL
jgi:hypothetical protein